MEGFAEKAEEVLGVAVKVGFLSAVKDRALQAQSALYSTAVGLLRKGIASPKIAGPNRSQAVLGIQNRLSSIQQLCREYF